MSNLFVKNDIFDKPCKIYYPISYEVKLAYFAQFLAIIRIKCDRR